MSKSDQICVFFLRTIIMSVRSSVKKSNFWFIQLCWKNKIYGRTNELSRTALRKPVSNSTSITSCHERTHGIFCRFLDFAVYFFHASKFDFFCTEIHWNIRNEYQNSNFIVKRIIWTQSIHVAKSAYIWL